MRLIDAEALKEKITKDEYESAVIQGFAPQLVDTDVFLDYIDNAPTIEAKPVVYCKDCKYSRMYCFGDCEEPVLACCDVDDDGTIYCAESVNEYDYCSKGEKRDAQMDEGVKIPVISMDDVPKIMDELPYVEENPILKAVNEMEK